ncbi:hypothetical protein [Proteiniclasticum ruminis]|uniref:hypothetical protein n=1 Tax=Proteiniclasticum ruminis TaxID=398199 RepID=UPI0028A78687|nr:hypothetical protein [Proteiniclasticum ruminis]
MKKVIKGKRGITLIELILSLALVSLVIMLSTNILMVGMKSQDLSVKEYAVQSEMRIAAERTNEIVRYSKAVFAVPKSFVSSESTMDPGWSYLMTSLDGKRIVTMEYDEDLSKHVERTIVNESEDKFYYIVFDKNDSANSDTVISYQIYSYRKDHNGHKTDEKLIYETTLETINAIQIVDKGTDSSPSVALAYRSDGQTSGKGKNQIAYITIVIDVSNSMNLTPAGGGSTSSETTNSRISRVRTALYGDGTSNGKGIIQMFSKEENVFISLVPFANTANFPSPHANTDPSAKHPFYEAYNSADANTLITSIKDLKADGHRTSLYGSGQGGTNTGDGLRRAYYLHESFRDRMSALGTPIDEKDQVHHYMMILVDGETTFETDVYKFTDEGYYIDSGRSVYIGWTQYKRFDWETNWNQSKISNYDQDGNIPVDTLSNYNPPENPLIIDKYHTDSVISYRSRYSTHTYSRPYVNYVRNNGDKVRPIVSGNGSSTINNSSYINTIGTKIQGFEDSAGIKSYLIGYANGLTTNINYIGNKIGTEASNRYVYNSSNFNLDDIFKNIATDIMADFWIAAGPQIY